MVKAREKCDGTVLGAEVDNYGCGTRSPKVERFVLDIKFAHDSYEIPASAYQEIQRLARFLDEHEQLSIVIEGHTSKVGSREYNQVLSNNRAKAVAQALIGNFSINEDRVAVAGIQFRTLAYRVHNNIGV